MRTAAVLVGGGFVIALMIAVVALAFVPADISVGEVVQVAQLTGPQSINQTDTKYGVAGTDLGIMWDNGQGQVLIAFGDTFGNLAAHGPGNTDWRSNVLALSSDRNLADGLTFDAMVMDRVDGMGGHAKELLLAQRVNGVELTVIPTAGVAVGDRQYMHYMSVNRWGAPGEWFTNYAGIAYSDDNGRSWVKEPGARWDNDAAWTHPFQMAAFAKDAGYVYMFGTPNGRWGGVSLARVAEANLLQVEDYEYWDGTDWQRNDPLAATVIVQAPAGELSVCYNTALRRWLMVYLDVERYALVLRHARQPSGPWSEAQTIATGAEYPQLYGGYIHPWSANEMDLYLTLSQWGPYNVFLMRATLETSSPLRRVFD